MTASEAALVPSTSLPIANARDVAFDYLRATLTLMVVAHHSSLAYTTFAKFDKAHYLLSTAPVVDSTRWLFLDYAENFNDVFFMSLMFFISGLFVWPALKRSGAADFMRSRALRLGVPFVVVWALWMPLAYYASWQMTGQDAGYWDYWWNNVGEDRLPSGPLWFVWLLLFFDILAAGVFVARPGRSSSQGASQDWSRRHPVILAAGMFVICAIVYLPLLKAFGFGAWGTFLVRPLFFQLSRIGLYFVWFAAGIWVGWNGVGDGLLAADGALARRWRWWCRFCFLAYNALVFVPLVPALTAGLSADQRGVLEGVLWTASCVASSFAFLALFRGVVRMRRTWMDSISRSAYVIYLVHYVFVVWVQRALLGVDLHAGLKFVVTFVVAAGLSWLTAQLLLTVPGLRRIL
ncbi:MAG TPA: acyltransferase [Stellaceae bacterium]|nr:acyltransferase [Stellaceae bacterium]